MTNMRYVPEIPKVPKIPGLSGFLPELPHQCLFFLSSESRGRANASDWPTDCL